MRLALDAARGRGNARAHYRIIAGRVAQNARGALSVGGASAVPDRIRRLLDYIVTQYVVRDEQKDIDLNAPSTESGDTLETDKAEAARREADRADDLAGAFQRGLVAAYRARVAGHAEIALDDRQAEEDQMADALIRFLVSFDLASSRSEETEPYHYVYHISPDWDLLTTVAASAGVDLDHALQQLSS